MTILHTNDLHSHFENWPKIRRFLQQKQTYASEHYPVVTVDLGDFCDRVHPLTEATNGKENIALMNQVTYDAVTIGNNEGIGNTKEQLDNLYQEANFPVVVSNLSSLDQQASTWCKNFTIHETPSGTRIGVIGLTAPFPFSYEPLGWQVSFPDEVLPPLLDELEPQTDVIVLLSHLGYLDDEHIAIHYPQIDVIIGSHTHHLYEEGKLIGDTLLAAAGKFGQYVGEIVIELSDQHQIVSKKAITHPTKLFVEQLQDQEEIKAYEIRGHQLLSEQTIGHLPVSWETDAYSEHSYIHYALEAMADFSQADAYLLSTGLFLGGLSKGIVSRDDLHRTLPHPMHMIRVTLRGKDLIDVLTEMESQHDYLLDYPIIGMGFRGKVFGELKAKHIQKVENEFFIQHQSIDQTQEYQLIMMDHYSFIKFFPKLTALGKIESLCPSLLRNVVAKYINKTFKL
ncbi:bifunctional metallophosphatase/5'-nucleotidase [Vagococcus xieshaowenii]|uniref:bifunctional metallophosphatase/5'-nucleotidase n=1 Tax=Vagococcus xieshaowenii TaxID=2562451 RepID=UPI001F521AAC|nr:bifunctional metallophosphatase/5'-nucleotidase [Vagococcus xieshaowenii]